MKIVLFSVLFMISTALFSQTIVETTPKNKNVLIEEFTGSSCSNCPDAHRIVNEISATNPGRICPINIHYGSYAQSAYTTNYGNAIGSMASPPSFPRAMINRHIFTSYSYELTVSRSDFLAISADVMNTYSPVNVAVEVKSYNSDTREMTVLVEVYYTSSEGVTPNYLNLAVLQNNIIGYQLGSAYNPDYVVGSNYKHMHMLRHMLTGTWGVEISNTNAGSFWDSTFVFTVPENYNSVSTVIEDLEFVAFVTETHQEAISCANATVPANVGISENETSSINIYPNPATDFIQIDINAKSNSNGSINIYDYCGNVVYSSELNVNTGLNKNKINTEKLANGLYFVNIKAENESYTKKFSIIK